MSGENDAGAPWHHRRNRRWSADRGGRIGAGSVFPMAHCIGGSRNLFVVYGNNMDSHCALSEESAWDCAIGIPV